MLVFLINNGNPIVKKTNNWVRLLESIDKNITKIQLAASQYIEHVKTQAEIASRNETSITEDVPSLVNKNALDSKSIITALNGSSDKTHKLLEALLIQQTQLNQNGETGSSLLSDGFDLLDTSRRKRGKSRQTTRSRRARRNLAKKRLKRIRRS